MSIIYINPFQFAAAGPAAFLLDAYPGAAAAYSLRQLRTGVTNVVRVRRNNDDAEDDFTATEVSDGTLAAWVGAGNDGFVRIWYDQSGNANDAGRTAAANQPQVVSSGSLITEGGKPAVWFDGLDDSLDADTLVPTFSGSNKPLHALTVLKSNVANAGNITAWAFGASADLDPGLRLIGQNSGTNNCRFQERNDSNVLTSLTGGNITARSLVYAQSTTVSTVLRVNGAQVATDSAVSGQTTLAKFAIGCILRSTRILFWNGTIQEIVFYPADMTTSQAGLEANVNAHYSIYP